jgi:large subunit ribosomal protein L49
MMLRRLILKQENVGILTKLNQLKYLSTRYNNEKPEQQSIPSRPLDWKSFQLTNVVESKEEFKYVEKLLPIQVVPEPPKHDSYPTPSGWIPVNPEKSSKLPYHIFRTRFYTPIS